MFVTGATGFIGSHFVDLALRDGHKVSALRRDGSAPRLQLAAEPKWVAGDLDRLASAEPSPLHGHDVLVHLAAAGVNPGHAESRSWRVLFDRNLRDALSVWERAIEAGIRRLVICGSCFEYGKSGERYQFIPPTAPLQPTHAYAASKAAASIAAVGLARNRRVECVVLRPFHVFGPGEDAARLWPSLRAAAVAGDDYLMTPGEQIRDFVAVESVARTFLKVAVDRYVRPGEPEIHNVGSGMPQSTRQFAEHWWCEWAARGRLRPGALPYRDSEVMRYVPELTL